MVTNDDSIAEKLKMVRNHGMVEGYDTRILGLNLRLPELSAAIAKTQMVRLREMLELRRRNAEMLTRLISDVANDNRIILPRESQSKRFNWYLYTIALTKDNLRDNIQKKMALNDKIGATVYYDPPVHRTPYYERIMGSETAPNDPLSWGYQIRTGRASMSCRYPYTRWLHRRGSNALPIVLKAQFNLHFFNLNRF